MRRDDGRMSVGGWNSGCGGGDGVGGHSSEVTHLNKIPSKLS